MIRWDTIRRLYWSFEIDQCCYYFLLTCTYSYIWLNGDIRYIFYNRKFTHVNKNNSSETRFSLFSPVSITRYGFTLSIPSDCKYILVYERLRSTLIAMNGNTIIDGNKTPRIGDRIRESAGGSDGLEYVTRLQGDGSGLAGGWKSQCAPAGHSSTRSVRLAIWLRNSGGYVVDDIERRVSATFWPPALYPRRRRPLASNSRTILCKSFNAFEIQRSHSRLDVLPRARRDVSLRIAIMRSLQRDFRVVSSENLTARNLAHW